LRSARPRSSSMGPAVLMLVLSACLSVPALGQVARMEFEDGGGARVEMMRQDGETYFRLSDVALAVDGIRYWNPNLRKMTLLVGNHRITMAEDSRFGALDREVVNLKAPAVFADSEFWVPVGFLTGPLATATNAEVTWDPRERRLNVRALRPAVRSVDLRDTGDGTAVELGLTGPTDYQARSRTRGTVEVMFPGARLPDSLGVDAGTGLVSGVVIEESPEGVRAEVAVTENAGSYDVDLLSDPYRLEVLVHGSYSQETPTPQLREAKHLLPQADDVLGLYGRGIETVMIDPAHGGSDDGARGRSGLKEKDVTLAFARQLASALQSKGFYSFMTRSSDSFVPDERRSEIANLAVADVFISVQCGAWYSGWASGFSVCYYEPPASNGDAGAVQRGRGLPRVAGDAPDGVKDDLRWDRLQEQHIGESRTLARAVDASMEDALPLRNRGVEGRSLPVLAGCSMPAIQVEIGFITNRDEEALLSDPEFLRDVARAVASGIAAYRSKVEERNR
jgi:N-acetylmuramoyl-L-alanine amidase